LLTATLKGSPYNNLPTATLKGSPYNNLWRAQLRICQGNPSTMRPTSVFAALT